MYGLGSLTVEVRDDPRCPPGVVWRVHCSELVRGMFAPLDPGLADVTLLAEPKTAAALRELFETEMVCTCGRFRLGPVCLSCAGSEVT